MDRDFFARPDGLVDLGDEAAIQEDPGMREDRP
jgi:hypothetical protein